MPPPPPPPNCCRASHHSAAANDAALPPRCRQASKLAAVAALPPPLPSRCYRCRCTITTTLLCRCLPSLLCCRAVAWSAWEHLGELGRTWEASERLGEQVSLLVGELVGARSWGRFHPLAKPHSFWREQGSRGCLRILDESGVNGDDYMPPE